MNAKTMTIREIADLCGVDETTVCRWIEKASCKMPEVSCKMQEAREKKKPGTYSLLETLTIIRAGGKNTLADLLSQNAAESNRKVNFVGGPPQDVPQNAEVVTRADLADFGKSIVAEMMKQFLPMIQGQPKRATLPAPGSLEPRADLLRLVRNGAQQRDNDFRGTWHELYEQFNLRYHRNVQSCAKNRGLDTLDYVEDEGLLGELLALAYQIFGVS